LKNSIEFAANSEKQADFADGSVKYNLSEKRQKEKTFTGAFCVQNIVLYAINVANCGLLKYKQVKTQHRN